MSNEEIPKCKLDLNLYIGLYPKQDLDEDQNQLVSDQQQGPVDEQGQGQCMTSPTQSYGNYVTLLNVNFVPNSRNSSPYPCSELGQLLPPQTVTVETINGEPYHRSPKRLQLCHEQDPDEDQRELVHQQVQDSVEEQVQRQSMELSGSTLQLFPPQAVTNDETTIADPSHRGRKRLSCVDNVEIKPPYPWATNRPAKIKSIRDLSLENINVITGQVTCKFCDKDQTLEYNLEEKFSELCQFIVKEKEQMRRQSPNIWMHPKLPLCMICNNEMKPKICLNMNEINWLFLLLSQLLGYSTLEELKFFCKWNKQHCTGSKDRVLYLTYLALCKQLEPNGPFNP